MAPEKCTHNPKCSAKAEEDFHAAIAKAWENLRASSAKADEDLQKTADKAIAEFRHDLNRQKEMWEQGQLGASRTYLDVLASTEHRSERGSATAKYITFEDNSLNLYKANITKATQRQGKMLKENDGFRCWAWNDANKQHRQALKKADEDYWKAQAIAMETCRNDDNEAGKAKGDTDGTRPTQKPVLLSEDE